MKDMREFLQAEPGRIAPGGRQPSGRTADYFPILRCTIVPFSHARPGPARLGKERPKRETLAMEPYSRHV
jgi:hypothetical protein